MAVETVTRRPRGNPAVEDLQNLERSATLVGASEDEVRARPIATGHRELSQRLGEDGADNVELACHQAEAVAHRGGEARAQNRVLRELHVDDVVVTIVEHEVW